MRLSEGVEWGLHCAVILAALPPGAVLPGKAMAELHGLSESYLLKHLQALTGAGLLESVPGPKGGYRLARPADQVTMLDVVEAVEGLQPAFRCAEIRQRGPLPCDPADFRVPCAINATMLKAELAWKRELRAKTLAEIVAGVGAQLSPERVQNATAWLSGKVRF